MSTGTAGLIGALAALVVVAIAWLILRNVPRDAGPQTTYDEDVAQHLTRVVDALSAHAILVGPHDEVLHANEPAVAAGTARGTRIGIPELLTLVREARRAEEVFLGPLDQQPEPGRDAADLHVRVIPFQGGMVLVIAEDESGHKRVDAVRRDFVANISHELKTPIGAIGILSEAVEAAKDEPAEVERFSRRLQRESARLAELVGQIIELSRLQSEEKSGVSEPVDLQEVINEALSRTEEAAQGRGVTLLRATAPVERLYVLGDRWQLSDAVANLVQNAITYSDRNARVAVTLQRVEVDDDVHVEIKVADNGIGIAVEDQERIFERFYRVDYGRSRESGGTGLGLSIVRHIVSGHGGTIHVWSRPRQGSTFTIRLPLHVPGDDFDDVITEEEET